MIDSFPHKQPDTCVNKQQLLCLHNTTQNENQYPRFVFHKNRLDVRNVSITNTTVSRYLLSFSPQSSFIPPVSESEEKTLCARASEIS